VHRREATSQVQILSPRPTKNEGSSHRAAYARFSFNLTLVTQQPSIFFTVGRERVQSIMIRGDLAMNNDPEILVGLSTGELEALSESLLAPSAPARLDELLARNAQSQLEASEVSELDRLLERVDQLTVLKTRAKYTLQHDQAGASRA
jgi:hypothetical protein